jgi:hypothetical protein
MPAVLLVHPNEVIRICRIRRKPGLDLCILVVLLLGIFPVASRRKQTRPRYPCDSIPSHNDLAQQQEGTYVKGTYVKVKMLRCGFHIVVIRVLSSPGS